MAENEEGIAKVGALIDSAVGQLHVAEKRKALRWPKRGEKLEACAPGEWEKDGFVDETGYLPWCSPVKPLGYSGEDFYLLDTMGQVFNTGTAALGVERLQKLFAGHEAFLDWAWPRFDDKGKVKGFAAEQVRSALFAACRERGAWSSSDVVRGRGAWRDSNGDLVIHCGEHLWVKGKLQEAGELGDYLYIRRPKALVPWRRRSPTRTIPLSRSSRSCAPGRWIAATSTPSCCWARSASPCSAAPWTGGRR